MSSTFEIVCYILVGLRPIILSLSPQDPFGPLTGAVQTLMRKFNRIVTTH